MDAKTGWTVPVSERRKELNDLMEFVAFTNLFRAIKRTIWFKGMRDDEPERDGEHSFQVALCAWYANARLELGLDTAKLIAYALVHDVVETYAKETPAFADLHGKLPAPSRKTKAQREKASLARIEREWGVKFPPLLAYMQAYQNQEDEESRFVNAFEKLVATINIYQDGGRTYKRVGSSFKALNTYKTRRVKRHPVVKELFDEMRGLLILHKHTLFPVDT